LERWALAMVVGGALGNLWDRLARGTVTDFVDVYYGEWHWATFNVADSAITVGAILLGLSMLIVPVAATTSTAGQEKEPEARVS
jgi:signal peptidase II